MLLILLVWKNNIKHDTKKSKSTYGLYYKSELGFYNSKATRGSFVDIEAVEEKVEKYLNIVSVVRKLRLSMLMSCVICRTWAITRNIVGEIGGNKKFHLGLSIFSLWQNTGLRR